MKQISWFVTEYPTLCHLTIDTRLLNLHNQKIDP